MAKPKSPKSGISSLTKSNAHTRQCDKCPIFLRWLILSIIVFATAAVVIVIVFAHFSSPEYQIKQKIAHYAANYYEYIYENMLKSDRYSGDPSVLEKYSASGLTPVTLRQLLPEATPEDTHYISEDADYLLRHCDSVATTATFYPDPPYSRTNYHVEYNYSCDF